MDPGNQVAAQFGLRYTMPEYVRSVYQVLRGDLPKVNGDDSWTLPITSRFIIDRTGTIRAADFNPDQSIRPEPSATVDLLKNLALRS
jgi:peroxiredoxin